MNEKSKKDFLHFFKDKVIKKYPNLQLSITYDDIMHWVIAIFKQKKNKIKFPDHIFFKQDEDLDRLINRAISFLDSYNEYEE